MQTLLRWAVKIVLGLLAFLAWETAYAGIPENISKQVALVQTLGGEALLRYVELPLLGFVLFVLAIGPARVTRSLKEASDWVKERPEVGRTRAPETQEQLAPVSEDLRQPCCELSTKLSAFYERWWENKDEALQSEYMMSLYNDPAGDQKRSEEIARHEEWLIKEYSKQFESDMLRLSDELAQQRCITPETRNRFENPEKPRDIEYIAQRLDALCNSPDFDPQEWNN